MSHGMSQGKSDCSGYGGFPVICKLCLREGFSSYLNKSHAELGIRRRFKVAPPIGSVVTIVAPSGREVHLDFD